MNRGAILSRGRQAKLQKGIINESLSLSDHKTLIFLVGRTSRRRHIAADLLKRGSGRVTRSGEVSERDIKHHKFYPYIFFSNISANSHREAGSRDGPVPAAESIASTGARTTAAAGAGTTAVVGTRATALAEAGTRVAVGDGTSVALRAWTTAAGARTKAAGFETIAAGAGTAAAGAGTTAAAGTGDMALEKTGYEFISPLPASQLMPQLGSLSRRQRPSRQWQGHVRRLWTRQCWWQRTGTGAKCW